MENKIAVKGDKAIDFTYENAFGETNTFAEKVKASKKTCLIFLRYYGCTICQLDIKSYHQNYAKFIAKDAQILLVLQSKPGIVANGITEGDIEFEIACDPQAKLYETYNVKAAKSKLGMASIGAIKKISAAKKGGFEHGEFEGNELQLPAVFIVDADMNILYDHRAKDVADIPDVQGLLNLL